MKPLRELKSSLERRAVSKALAKHDGCIRRAARELKVDTKIIYRVVARQGLQHLVKRHKGGPPLQGNDAWRALGDEVCA